VDQISLTRRGFVLGSLAAAFAVEALTVSEAGAAEEHRYQAVAGHVDPGRQYIPSGYYGPRDVVLFLQPSEVFRDHERSFQCWSQSPFRTCSWGHDAFDWRRPAVWDSEPWVLAEELPEFVSVGFTEVRPDLRKRVVSGEIRKLVYAYHAYPDFGPEGYWHLYELRLVATQPLLMTLMDYSLRVFWDGKIHHFRLTRYSVNVEIGDVITGEAGRGRARRGRARTGWAW
jgi:hypothetical protein